MMTQWKAVFCILAVIGPVAIYALLIRGGINAAESALVFPATLALIEAAKQFLQSSA